MHVNNAQYCKNTKTTQDKRAPTMGGGGIMF